MQVNLSYGVSQGNNGAVSSVARQASSGPGVSTSNLDCTRTRIVKRGSVVEFRGGVRVTVVRVRGGVFYYDVPGYKVVPSFTPCCDVKVVA